MIARFDNFPVPTPPFIHERGCFTCHYEEKICNGSILKNRQNESILTGADILFACMHLIINISILSFAQGPLPRDCHVAIFFVVLFFQLKKSLLAMTL